VADSSSSQSSRLWPMLTMVLVAVICVWLLMGYIPAKLAWDDEVNNVSSTTPLGRIGTYGDSFGAVNSLCSSLALAGVALTLWLQHREQVDARLRAEVARSDSEAARKHDAELAMLSALLTSKVASFHAKTSVQQFNLEALYAQHRYQPMTIQYRENMNADNLVELQEIEKLMRIAYEKLGMEPPKTIPLRQAPTVRPM
jgi:hypothetical protein